MAEQVDEHDTHGVGDPACKTLLWVNVRDCAPDSLT